MMYVRTYVSVTLRNVAVTSRRNVANQRSHVIIASEAISVTNCANLRFLVYMLRTDLKPSDRFKTVGTDLKPYHGFKSVRPNQILYITEAFDISNKFMC